MSRRLAFLGPLAFGLALAGCAHRPEPRIETVIAKVPVREPCVPADTPPAPAAYPDDALPAGPEHLVDRYRLRGAGNEARKARLATLEPIIAACR